ncbi:MAG: nickel pincer cofactor biosynthesis protein LarB [Chloroflexota bacterium]
MNRDALYQLLTQVANGQQSVDNALESLRTLPFEEMDFATLDHHRTLRTGFPEVVYAQGKTAEQVAKIMARLVTLSPRILATRASMEQYEAAVALVPELQYHASARCIWVDQEPDRDKYDGIVMVAAGTSDLPVLEEAILTADLMGHAPKRIVDVGVAGLHRLLPHVPTLQTANVVVVAAGMEGALASVVGGLTDAPVIAVPTSVGYGANFGGISALLSMLNSCASGVATVNIDNGYGAGNMAALINQRIVSG